MTVFTMLPQDMLQHEINRFLDPISRAEFNAVIKPDERVYMKFPPGHAIKHAIKVKHNMYEVIAQTTIRALSLLQRPDPPVDVAVRGLKKLFAFLGDDANAIIFMHKIGLKEKMIHMLEMWMDDDNELYDYLEDGGLEMRTRAESVRDILVHVPFVRHI